MTGYFKAQTDWLTSPYISNGEIALEPTTQPTFVRKYLTEDIAALARIDETHEDLSADQP